MSNVFERLSHCLHRQLKINYKNDPQSFRRDGKIFEIVAALICQEEYKIPFYTWNEISPDIKDDLGLPQVDVGIDHLGFDGAIIKHVGQSKDYKAGSYVKAKDIDRTRLCVYEARMNCVRRGIESSLDGAEFCTPSNVRMGNPKIGLPKTFKQRIISDSDFDRLVSAAMNLTLPEADSYSNIRLQGLALPIGSKGSDTERKYILRQCQIEALKRISPDGITRLKLACGSGKTLIAVEYIKKNPGTHLYLVPTLVLQEQTDLIFQNYGLSTVLVGTNDPFNESTDFKNKVTICVYNSVDKLININYDKIWIDEGHHLKNAEEAAENSYIKTISKLIKKVPSVLLSATLLEYDYNYTIREAINDKNIVDYDICIPFFDTIDDDDIAECKPDEEKEVERPVKVKPGKEGEVDFLVLATYLKDNPRFVSILAYTHTIKRSKKFARICNSIGVTAISISSEDPKRDRDEAIKGFKNGTYKVLVSVNVLSEGIDLPNGDTCLFVDPRKSYNYIIQALGRVLRLYPGKNIAHVIVPVVYSEGMDIRKNHIIEFLGSINQEDDLLKKLSHGKTAKIHTQYVKYYKRHNEISNRRANKGVNKEELEKFNTKMELIFEEIYDSMVNCLSYDNWPYKYGLFFKYCHEKERLPKWEEKFESVDLFRWLTIQRASFKKGSLTQERINKMDQAHKDWNKPKEDKNEELWNVGLNRLIVFYKTYGKFPSQKKNGSEEDEVYNWYTKQIYRRRNNTLTQDQIRLLDSSLPDWYKETRDEKWYNNCQRLKEFYMAAGRFVRQTEDKFLYKWWMKQQEHARRRALPDEKIKKLDEINPNWIGEHKIERIENPDILNKSYEEYKLGDVISILNSLNNTKRDWLECFLYEIKYVNENHKFSLPRTTKTEWIKLRRKQKEAIKPCEKFLLDNCFPGWEDGRKYRYQQIPDIFMKLVYK